MELLNIFRESSRLLIKENIDDDLVDELVKTKLMTKEDRDRIGPYMTKLARNSVIKDALDSAINKDVKKLKLFIQLLTKRNKCQTTVTSMKKSLETR